MERKAKSADDSSPGNALHDLFMEVFLLREKLGRVMDAVHEAAGLGTPQLRVAHTALDLEDATVPRIAERMDVSRQFVQRVCDNLVWEGILYYKCNPRHRRSHIVEVTDSGRKKIAEVSRNEAAIIARFLPGLDMTTILGATKILREIGTLVNENMEETP